MSSFCRTELCQNVQRDTTSHLYSGTGLFLNLPSAAGCNLKKAQGGQPNAMSRELCYQIHLSESVSGFTVYRELLHNRRISSPQHRVEAWERWA